MEFQWLEPYCGRAVSWGLMMRYMEFSGFIIKNMLDQNRNSQPPPISEARCCVNVKAKNSADQKKLVSIPSFYTGDLRCPWDDQLSWLWSPMPLYERQHLFTRYSGSFTTLDISQGFQCVHSHSFPEYFLNLKSVKPHTKSQVPNKPLLHVLELPNFPGQLLLHSSLMRCILTPKMKKDLDYNLKA